MLLLLHEKVGLYNELGDVNGFERDCAPYLNANRNTIPKEKAQELFDRFKALYK